VVLWTPRYVVRRVAWHTVDHLWEIEDRFVWAAGGMKPVLGTALPTVPLERSMGQLWRDRVSTRCDGGHEGIGVASSLVKIVNGSSAATK
jgi:hypothetical protein